MIISTTEQMEQFGQQLGSRLRGGEVLELIGDIGAGKTTLTRGIARGLGVSDTVTSPSFTISCNYPGRDNLALRHYDFYRLTDAGIMSMELAESTSDPHSVTIIEWADSVRNILPADHVTIRIQYLADSGRQLDISVSKSMSYLLGNWILT